MYSCYLLISSDSIRSIPFLSFIAMKCSLGISNFLEVISSVSHSIVFFYFFALFTEEGFLISPCYSMELSIQMGISFLFSFAFSFSYFSAICKASSDNHVAFLHGFFLGMVLVPASCTISRTSIHSSSSTLSVRSNPRNLQHLKRSGAVLQSEKVLELCGGDGWTIMRVNLTPLNFWYT